MKKTEKTIQTKDKTMKTGLLMVGMLLSFQVMANSNQPNQPAQNLTPEQRQQLQAQMNERHDAIISEYNACKNAPNADEEECAIKREADNIQLNEEARQFGIVARAEAMNRARENVASAGNAARDAQCLTFIKSKEGVLNTLYSAPVRAGSADRLPGSKDLENCLAYTHLTWDKVITYTGADLWDKGWKEFAAGLAQKLDSEKGTCRNIESFYVSAPSEINNFIGRLASCEALRQITAKTDFKDSKHVNGGKSATQSSLDQKIKCQSRGVETQDYKACVKTLNFYNGALVGQTVFTQVQELGYQGHAIENSVLDPNDPTSGLRAQQKDIQKRASMTQTRAGIDVAKGGALLTLWQSIPSHQDVQNQCIANLRGRDEVIRARLIRLVDSLDMRIGGALPADLAQKNTMSESDRRLTLLKAPTTVNPKFVSDKCRQHVNGQFVILNQEAKDAIKQAMILAGIDGVKHLTAANLLKKQANQVGRVINDVNNFNPTGLEYFGEEFNGNECALNPAAEGCDDFLNKRSFGFGQTAPIQIHGMENASMFGRNDSDINNGTRDAASSPVDRTDAPKPIGIFDPNADNPSGLVDRTRAASVTSDGAGAPAGGGGGGGVGGGGSPPGAPGGGAAASDAPRMGLPGAGSSNLAYSRGTGAISGMGGRGAQGNRSRDNAVENPFAGLFGQDGAQGSSLNFREGASEDGEINRPDTSIFQIISDRYIAVHQNDRLLLYEAQEEQGPLR